MDELAKRFSDLVAQYGPGVVDVAKAAARMSGYSTLASSAIAFFIAWACLVGARSSFRLQPSWDTTDDWFIPPRFIGCCALICAVISLAIGLWCWIDPWTWSAIYRPELWIAKRVLRL